MRHYGPRYHYGREWGTRFGAVAGALGAVAFLIWLFDGSTVVAVMLIGFAIAAIGAAGGAVVSGGPPPLHGIPDLAQQVREWEAARARAEAEAARSTKGGHVEHH